MKDICPLALLDCWQGRAALPFSADALSEMKIAVSWLPFTAESAER